MKKKKEKKKIPVKLLLSFTPRGKQGRNRRRCSVSLPAALAVAVLTAAYRDLNVLLLELTSIELEAPRE